MKKSFALLLSLAMVFTMVIPALALPVPVRSLTEAEEDFVEGNFDLDYGWEFMRWMSEDIGPRSTGNYGTRTIMHKAISEWESFGYETNIYTGYARSWPLNTEEPTSASYRHNGGYIEIQGKTHRDATDTSPDPLNIGQNPLKFAYVGTDYADNTVYKFGGKEENRWDRQGPAYKNDVTGIVILDWSGTGANGAPNAPLTVPENTNFAGKTVVVRNMTETPTPTGTGAVALNNPSAVNYYNTALNLQNANAGAVIFQTAKPSPAYQITQDGIPGIWINGGNNSYSRMSNTVPSETTTDITIPVGMTLHTYTNDLFMNMTEQELATTKINYMMEYHDQVYQAYAVKKARVPTDKTIYFTAHTDSYTGTAPFGPGANDNASGAGLVMAVAKAYANVETDVNLVFHLNDVEERGLIGTYHFVNTLTDEQKKGFVANYNFDMVATGQENVQYLAFGTPNARLSAIRSEINDPFWYYWNNEEAVEIAQSLGSLFDNYAYVAPRTGLLLPKNILFNFSSSSDHRVYFQAATSFDKEYPNMTNAWQFDWRRRPWGANEFEAVYHKIGDNTEGMSRERFNIAAEVAGLALGYDLGVLSGPVQAGVQAFWFELATQRGTLMEGETFTVTPNLGNELSSNAAVLNVKFDKDVFTFNGVTSDAITIIGEPEETAEGVKITVANLEDYNLTALGDLSFTVKDGAPYGDSTVEVLVEYVFKKDDDKAIGTAGAGFEFLIRGMPEYNLLTLSDAIDFYGVTSNDVAWDEARFFDFNGNGQIDINDITFIAQQIA